MGICLQPPLADEFNFTDLSAAITGFKIIFLLLHPHTAKLKITISNPCRASSLLNDCFFNSLGHTGGKVRT